ncbi:MAG: UDP-N-acetylglucosamine--N-acetylmuramyl-(pentapeptide) pyrophosphoryl-undecaprenol N-acetylglucosamine transferase, partial [Holophaga sp.]|nr:UDP-N-acetylglucosamine--N-acetylmuramyl-(pentapeptide) pyrophosphoryl-undecaprenol N-acetylglucosamine transferase [Holophaga sp.]
MSIDPDFSNALVLTGGGTGGHYFPALALAQGAKLRWAELPIVFVGAKRGIEAGKLPESGWPYLLLDVEGFLGRSPLRVLKSLGKLWRAMAELRARWKVQRPRAVIATGGYASAPALFAARSMGIPYFLHESNAEPGWLIRLLAPGAQRVWCGMAAAESRLPRARCRFVGTPVREDFLREFAGVDVLQPPYRLLVLGGSGGARPLNEALMGLAPQLLERFPDWEVVHQTGARDFEALTKREHDARHRLTPFLDSMATELEAASVVISRSGASTCAELKACGRPAILVPFPASAGDHQRQNARAMAQE